ncbi:MAG: NAD(P)H-quinone oxidoreductase [Pseudomonadota bacterium]
MQNNAWFVGDDQSIAWREAPVPEVGADDVLIDVRAAGVNRPDLLQRMGVYPPPPGASEALGLEVAGTISAIGSAVTRFSIGERVMALVPGGGYAEQCRADQGSVMPLPQTLSFEEGAAFPETAFTVWTNTFEAGGLAHGERLFVHGATSGIGTMAAAIASAMGHEVFGTAGTDSKVKAAEELGFTKVWNYKTEDWSEAMQGHGGVDVALDMVGGDYVPRNLAMLRDGGRHVSIAFQAGLEAQVNIMAIMRKRLTLTGSTLRARPNAEKARLRGAVESSLFPLVSIGKLKPHIGLSLPMSEAEKAHDAMRSGALIGKAVLTR